MRSGLLSRLHSATRQPIARTSATPMATAASVRACHVPRRATKRPSTTTAVTAATASCLREETDAFFHACASWESGSVRAEGTTGSLARRIAG